MAQNKNKTTAKPRAKAKAKAKAPQSAVGKKAINPNFLDDKEFDKNYRLATVNDFQDGGSYFEKRGTGEDGKVLPFEIKSSGNFAQDAAKLQGAVLRKEAYVYIGKKKKSEPVAKKQKSESNDLPKAEHPDLEIVQKPNLAGGKPVYKRKKINLIKRLLRQPVNKVGVQFLKQTKCHRHNNNRRKKVTQHK